VNEKDMGLCYRSQRSVCSKKKKEISVVKNREERGSGVFEESDKKEYI